MQRKIASLPRNSAKRALCRLTVRDCLIGVLRAKFAGQMDFGKASGMVKAALSG